MIEKVNPCHPDKVADRIAGAIVDLAYKKSDNPKIAVEVLLGHGECNIIIESSIDFGHYDIEDIENIVTRITGSVVKLNINVVPQDVELAKNQSGQIKCGDNGIFKGVPLTEEECILGDMARDIYALTQTDGKYIFDNASKKLIICQSNINTHMAKIVYRDFFNPLGSLELIINPLGE